jgi:hypothetical protein
MLTSISTAFIVVVVCLLFVCEEVVVEIDFRFSFMLVMVGRRKCRGVEVLC